MSTAVQYPQRDLIDLHSNRYPSSPSSASTSAFAHRDSSLDRWRESDGDDEWANDAAGKGKGKAVEAAEPVKRQSKMSERSKRAVASESWDDDFLFQHDPAPPPPRTPSRSRSRPTTPAHRSTSSSSRIPPSPSSPPLPRPTSPPKSLVLNGPATLSLDSLASSIGWSSDQDPTVTVPPSAEQFLTPRPSARPAHQMHRKSESTATARPPLSRQTTPKSRIPKPASSTITRHRAPPSEDDEFRSETPSLTEDSFNSFTTGEEPVTETEDEQTDVAIASPTLRQAPVIERVPSTRKWRFRRGGKAEASEKNKAEEPPLTFNGFLGREPEVMIIDRQELARSRQSNSPRNILPRAQQHADSATPRQPRATAATRAKHSSAASSATASSGASSNDRPRRTSMQFAPLSFLRRGSVADAQSPSAASTTFSWREYNGTTTEDDDDGRPTGADISDLSDDDAGRIRARHSSHPSASAANTPSTSYISPSTRPVSPVESILGGDKTRWNASQVSFASTASAFALRRDASSRQYEGKGADASASRKRKLVKKRPASTAVGAQESLTASSLGLSSDGTSERPLLAPSIFSTSSGGSSYPDSNRTVLTRSRSTRPMTSLAFARESGDEGGNRGTTRPSTRHRSVTNPPRPASTVTVSPRKGEKGQVVELDREWLGVVPFPPSPRASLDAPAVPPSLPTSNSRSSLRPSSGFLRKMSGKSHPPVTGRTQAEAKQAKRGSGIGSSITNLLSRSTSALPLTGKRAPSPAPSSKSVKSSKSTLLRKSSKKGKDDEPAAPESPSLGMLKKRRSVTAPASIKSPSMPSLPSSPPPPPLPRSGSAFSFITRARGFSRSSRRSETPPSPRKPSTPVDAPPVPPTPPPPRPPRPSSAADSARQPPSRGQLATTAHMPNPEFSKKAAVAREPRTPAAAVPQPTRLAPVVSNKPPRARPHQAGHRPSVSLSSIMPLRSTSPLPRPPQPPVSARASQQSLASDKPSTGGDSDRPPTFYSFGEDLVDDENAAAPRRNSLSDLRIPARITNAQKKIEEDLERVKQFATAIEELKALRRQYQELVQVVTVSPLSTDHLSPDQPSWNAVAKTAQAIRRVELDYASWWEQAQTLIDLGDGKPQQDVTRPSPGTLASRRDRCVSLAPEATDRRRSQMASESETETIVSRPANSKRQVERRPSASSIETAASVALRQKEMLRGVLAAPHKGASLPSRAPPSPRPPLTVITQPDSAASSVSLLSGRRVSPLFAALASPPSPSFTPDKASPASRRVSRTGVFGIREFLLRLRSRATEELAASVQGEPLRVSADPLAADVAPVPSRRSVSDPTYRPRHVSRPTPAVVVAPQPRTHAGRVASTSTSDSDEDWDLEFLPARPTSMLRSHSEDATASISRRHERTQSVVGGSSKAAAADAKLVLTTEAMPSLLEKVREVREACETCIGLLKGLTV